MEVTPELKEMWVSFADLFLDTDVRLFYDAIVQKMNASPYSDQELKMILVDQVAPALSFNLRQVAGEWAGWRDEVVIELISTTLHQQRMRLFGFRLKSRYALQQWALLCEHRAQANPET